MAPGLRSTVTNRNLGICKILCSESCQNERRGRDRTKEGCRTQCCLRNRQNLSPLSPCPRSSNRSFQQIIERTFPLLMYGHSPTQSSLPLESDLYLVLRGTTIRHPEAKIGLRTRASTFLETSNLSPEALRIGRWTRAQNVKMLGLKMAKYVGLLGGYEQLAIPDTSMLILPSCIPAPLCSDCHFPALARRTTILLSAQNLLHKASMLQEFSGTVKHSPL
ncbi:hypothetical protein IW261DRAFT_730639 [Armillaria novae-zelandiae]|uniref:Uncharacterized protein n=1 Tax=Armillaria novae-zelandiae TaxID=153914 RepID=A0AA39NVQ0_9AGAR|nr:hypothetical protein IW261DRAFT_730639 [Armillaria novae-zelandiae]